MLKDLFGFARRQSRGFWRDPGKLATFLSFALLVIAYGLHWQEQTRTVDRALLDLGKAQLAEIVPTAILTQVLLLSVYWFLLGRLTAVPGRTLAEPYKLFAGFAIAFAWLLLASVVPFQLAEGDAGTLGMALLGLITVFGLLVPLLIKLISKANDQARQGKPTAALAGGATALVMLTGLVATFVATVYAAVAESPSVKGLVATDFAIMTVLLLYTCFRFRAYIGDADVPAALPHLIDFSLAISACAIALVGVAGSEVTLGGVPPLAVAVAPPLIVAGMVYLVHLRRSHRTTPRWRACLAVAIVAGLLVGPVKYLLNSPIAAFAQLLPVSWG